MMVRGGFQQLEKSSAEVNCNNHRTPGEISDLPGAPTSLAPNSVFFYPVFFKNLLLKCYFRGKTKEPTKSSLSCLNFKLTFPQRF